jgi:hypothetical protein
MSKSPKPPGQLTVIGGGGVAVPAPDNTWRRLNSLANLADFYTEIYDDMEKQSVHLARRDPLEPIEPFDTDLSEAIDDIRRCQRLFKEVDKAEYYEESDDEDDDRDAVLIESIVAKRLALLLATVRSGAPKEAEPEGFNEILLAHVLDSGVGYLAFEFACRQIEKSQRYVRIPDLIEALDEQSELWRHRRWAVHEIEEFAAKIRSEMTKAETRLRLDKANDVVRRAGLEVKNQIYWRQQKQKEADEARAAAERAAEQAQLKVQRAEQELDKAVKALRNAEAERDKLDPTVTLKQW